MSRLEWAVCQFCLPGESVDAKKNSSFLYNFNRFVYKYVVVVVVYHILFLFSCNVAMFLSYNDPN